MGRRVFSSEEKAFIEGQRVLRLNSTTSTGQIHSVPVCFSFDGASFYVHRANEGAKRWRNLEANNRVSIELDSYTDDWSKNDGVLVYGRAVLAKPGTKEQTTGLSLLKKKYRQYERMPESVVMVKVEPVRIASWFLRPRPSSS